MGQGLNEGCFPVIVCAVIEWDGIELFQFENLLFLTPVQGSILPTQVLCQEFGMEFCE